jgi:hypothetical protein
MTYQLKCDHPAFIFFNLSAPYGIDEKNSNASVSTEALH